MASLKNAGIEKKDGARSGESANHQSNEQFGPPVDNRSENIHNPLGDQSLEKSPSPARGAGSTVQQASVTLFCSGFANSVQFCSILQNFSKFCLILLNFAKFC
jgi:hypothetical protein